MSISSLLGKKIGTTQVFREDTGEAVCVTAVETGPCTVTQIKTPDADGYSAVQIGYLELSKVNKPQRGANTGFRYLREVTGEDIEIGQTFDASLFEVGEKVNVTGLTRGRGFAGTVRRHGFHGGPKTHGQSDRHRAPGSIGAGTTPGKVIKGQKMSGHMGNVKVTTKYLEVLQTNPERNLVLIKGSIPGARNSLIMLTKSGR